MRPALSQSSSEDAAHSRPVRMSCRIGRPPNSRDRSTAPPHELKTTAPRLSSVPGGASSGSAQPHSATPQSKARGSPALRRGRGADPKGAAILWTPSFPRIAAIFFNIPRPPTAAIISYRAPPVHRPGIVFTGLRGALMIDVCPGKARAGEGAP